MRLTASTGLAQGAPAAPELVELVEGLVYRDGWSFRLEDLDRGQGSVGSTLTITVATTNSYPPHDQIRVAHLFPIPPAAYNRQSWRRWLLDQILLVEQHEACEFFTIDGAKPFAPNHGPGWDPYRIVEYEDDLARRTSFRGDVNT